MSEQTEKSVEDSPKPLGQHLIELRKAILYPLMLWAFGMVLGIIFQQEVVEALFRPVKRGILLAYEYDPSLPRAGVFQTSTSASRRLFVAPDKTIYVLKKETIHQVHPEKGPGWKFSLAGKGTSLAFSSDGKYIAASSNKGGLFLISTASGKPAWNNDELKDIEELSFSPESQTLVFSRFSGEVRGFSLDGAELYRYEFSRSEFLDDLRPINVAPMAVFMVIMKAALLFGLIPGLPFFIYSLWKFVRPGLYPHERRVLRPVLFFMSFLFFAGAAFAYYVVVPVITLFLFQLNAKWTVVMWDVTKYVDLVIVLMLGLGVIFELPLAIIVITQLRIVRPESLTRHRRMIWIGMFILAAFMSPPDPVSQLMLAIPTICLFEIGILVSRILLKKRDEENEDNQK